MAPPPPQPSAAAPSSSPAPVDALFLQNLMSRVQLRPPFLDTNSFLTQDLDDFLLNEFAALSAAAGESDGDDDEEEGLSDGEEVSGEVRRRRTLSREEAKLEKEIVRMVLAGDADETLKPNSGQSVAVGDHHVCVGFHDETGGEYRVWEWHGHVMLFDDEDGYSAEYIYGNHFEPLAAATARAKKKEQEKREKDLTSGLRDLIVGDGDSVSPNGFKLNGNGGGHTVVRKNVVNAPAAPAASLVMWYWEDTICLNFRVVFPGICFHNWWKGRRSSNIMKYKRGLSSSATGTSIVDYRDGMGEDDCFMFILKQAWEHGGKSCTGKPGNGMAFAIK